jgi:hypothetical protein
MLLQDTREYVFPIFEISSANNTVDVATATFLGTGFFVTRRGDAITAAHVLPDPKQLQPGRRIVAVVLVAGKQTVCWITQAAEFAGFDVALIKVNLTETKFLPVDGPEILPGTDVMVIGMPKHSVGRSGLEMRVLKGHVTGVYDRLELSFAVPAGMSGAPVFVGETVIGYATGRVRSEAIEDQTEELVTVADNVEKIRLQTTSSIIYYGLAKEFHALRDIRDPALSNQTLLELIRTRNEQL